MAYMVWDKPDVVEFLLNTPLSMSFARVQERRGLKALIKKRFGAVYKKCFRNALVVSIWSKGKYKYCEGFASTYSPTGRRGWHAHAWCHPVVVAGEPNDPTQTPWAMDPTWPWKHKGRVRDDSDYFGICVEPHTVLDFVAYLRSQGVANPSYSVLKYVDHYKQFLLGL